MDRPLQLLWCETCGLPETEPHEHPLTEVMVSEQGKTVFKFASVAFQDAALWDDYGQLIDAGIPFKDSSDVVRNFGLFDSPSLVRRLFHFHHLIQLVADIPGDWMEFGVFYGRDLAWWHILKTFQPHRHILTGIIGFDTWEGHVGTSEQDGQSDFVQPGAYATPPGYEQFLLQVLTSLSTCFNVGISPQLVKGDVTETLPKWLDDHPDRAVAFAYLDLDLYAPTRAVLEALKGRMPHGAVIGFDEFGTNLYPGEALAVREVFGFDRPFRKSPYGDWAYLVI